MGEGIHFGFTVSDAVLVMYWCGYNLVQGCGILCLAQYDKGCILGLQLFQSKQSTHNIFCHFHQWNYDYREALHHQTDHHPSFLHLSLVLGCLPVGGSNHWDVLLIVVQRCHIQCCQYLVKCLRADAQTYW